MSADYPVIGPEPRGWLARSFHCAYAFVFRYFWLPCTLCGQSFGGHEWKDYDGKPSVVDGTAICQTCTRSGRGSWGRATISEPHPAAVDDALTAVLLEHYGFVRLDVRYDAAKLAREHVEAWMRDTPSVHPG